MKTDTIILEKTTPNSAWVGCINSVNYRVERGVPVEVPHFLAEHIRRVEAERAIANSFSDRLSQAARRLV